MRLLLLLLTLFMIQVAVVAQSDNDSLPGEVTLPNVISYAIKHQPAVQKARLDEQIITSQVNSKLADWYPQLDFSYNLQHNFQLQEVVFQGQVIPLGNQNTSYANFGYTQNIVTPNLVFAAQTAKDTRKLSRQNTESRRIEVVANVSKAFYDVLLTQQQIKVATADIDRLTHSVHDAQSQYKNGLVDKTDYQRATIALNNAIALKRSNEESVKAKVEYLKYLMGYPVKATLDLVYDSAKLEGDAQFDVNQQADYNNRIEYQTLLTQRKLQHANTQYSKYSFIPSVSGYANYDLNYYNNNISNLYKPDYPNSFAGITVAFPLVHGGKRWMAIRQARWQEKKTDYDMADLKNNFNSEYAQAQAAYNGNLANYTALKDNMDLAQQVYTIVDKQYRSGVKAYLEVINAESDLRTSQINYYNSLFQLLASKIDLQRALGQLKY